MADMALSHNVHRKLDQIADRLSHLEEGQAKLERGLAALSDLLAPQNPVPGSAAKEEAQDGPSLYERFRLKGKEYKGFSIPQWRLLGGLWGREAVPIEDLLEHVYGHDSDKSDSALDSLKKRLNRKLRKQSCPARITAENGRYSLKIR